MTFMTDLLNAMAVVYYSTLFTIMLVDVLQIAHQQQLEQYYAATMPQSKKKTK
jgi:hypothetical protein